MSAQASTRSVTAFLNKLPKGEIDLPPEERTPIEELVYSFLLWESSVQRADNAFKRCLGGFVDLNDLRVSRPHEVQLALGKTYPMLEERVARLQASLHEIYIREYEVSLATLEGMSKRDARKYLESLEGMVPFATARVLLFKLGAHAIPVEQRLVDKLIEENVLEDDADLARAQSVLERHIKSDEGEKAALKLQAFSEGATKPPARSKTSKTKRTTKKRTPTSKKKTRRTKASGS